MVLYLTDVIQRNYARFSWIRLNVGDDLTTTTMQFAPCTILIQSVICNGSKRFECVIRSMGSWCYYTRWALLRSVLYICSPSAGQFVIDSLHPVREPFEPVSYCSSSLSTLSRESFGVLFIGATKLKMCLSNGEWVFLLVAATWLKSL